ncbi:MAG: hypothetical protein JW885_07865 [Deltaproteobacteria bacterium]|nr:hypothetical protein [Candidatus Zymogenaceae bacterium]
MQNTNEPSSFIISESSSLNAQESFFIIIRLLTCFVGIAVLLTGLGFIIVAIKEIYQAIMSPETITPVIEQWVEFFSTSGLVMGREGYFIPVEVISTGLVFIAGFLLASILLKLVTTGAKIIAHASIGKAAMSRMIDEAVKKQMQSHGR